MEKKTTLESNVEKVLEALRTAGYCESTIFNYQRVYVRLLRSATIMKTDAFNDALANYFVNDSTNVKTNERPKSDSPYVFLSYNAPHKPLKDHASCYFVVKNIFSRAGVRLGNELKGTRLLLHHVVSKMLKMGVAVQTISLTLGHVNPNSADIYLTTDEKGLRNCALTLSLIPMKVGALR